VSVEERRWAAAYFRVERDSAGVQMRSRQRRKATELAIEHGEAPPELPRDFVRIYDRAGEVVFQQDWGSERSSAMAHEARIIDDLLHLDVVVFCGKYAIEMPELLEPAPPATSAEIPPEISPEPGDDAAAEGEAPGRSEQGSG
jgi:hypothetical protein